MEKFEWKLKDYIASNNIKAEHLSLDKSCHSVEEAAEAVNGSVHEIVKNICMIDGNGRLLVAIVKGEDRASTSRVGKALQIEKPRLAEEKEVLEKTGYPAGGVPSFGYNSLFLVDPKVTELDFVYTGGGSPYSLVRIKVDELLKVNQGTVVRVRK